MENKQLTQNDIEKIIRRVKRIGEDSLYNLADLIIRFGYEKALDKFINDKFGDMIFHYTFLDYNENDVIDVIKETINDDKPYIDSLVEKMKERKKSKNENKEFLIKEIKSNNNLQNVIKDAFKDVVNKDNFYNSVESFIFSGLTKDEILKVNPKKLFAIMSMYRDELADAIEYFAKEYNENIEFYSNDEFNEIAPVIDELLENDNSFMNELKEKMKEFGEYYLETTDEDEFVNISPYTLSKTDDKVGDVIDTHGEFSVDLGTREAPFVFLNGKIEIGREADTHSMLLTRLVYNEESSPEYIRGKNGFDMTGDNELAFGHISNGLAFLEVVDNVSVDKVVNALIQEDIDKVYEFDQGGETLKRLASLI